MKETKRQVVGIGKPCRRRKYFHRPVPEDGAEIVDFAEARIMILRRRYFQKYLQSFLQLEAECNTLINERVRGQMFPIKPSQRARYVLLEQTSELLQFLGEVGAQEGAFFSLELVEHALVELCETLNNLDFAKREQTRTAARLFNRIEQHLEDIRFELEPLLPAHGLILRKPAYML